MGQQPPGSHPTWPGSVTGWGAVGSPVRVAPASQDSQPKAALEG